MMNTSADLALTSDDVKKIQARSLSRIEQETIAALAWRAQLDFYRVHGCHHLDLLTTPPDLELRQRLHDSIARIHQLLAGVPHHETEVEQIEQQFPFFVGVCRVAIVQVLCNDGEYWVGSASSF